MNLYLMRHGLAVERGTPGYDTDSLRPLTSKGERRIRRIAEAFARLEIEFERVLCSPLKRARQTADVLLEEMNESLEVQISEALAPGTPLKAQVDAIAELGRLAENILVVGHEPDLSQLAALLLSGEQGITLIFKKGGVAKLAVEELKPTRCATLEWLLTSRQMEMMV